MNKVIKKATWWIVGKIGRFYNYFSFWFNKDNNKIIKFDTSMHTENLGDFIIMYYCNRILNDIYTDKEFINISTHRQPTIKEEKIIKETKYKYICGTNLLTSNIEENWNWRLPDGLLKKLTYRNVVLFGVGWGNYQDECSDYTKMIYQCLLNPYIIHSVRDQYTEQKLKKAGVKNVINTGCPTMWRLTPDFCKMIPQTKSLDVVTTITDYRRDVEKDNFMLKILSDNYRYVYLWIQGNCDEEYLNTLNKPNNLIVIPSSLEAYSEILKNESVDYVGTRLHAGIFALNHYVRSIIIAVDNRAIEISKDTNLPIILRDNLEEELERKIISTFSINIKLKQENIDCFKSQFLGKE